jgi:hypothetical protein
MRSCEYSRTSGTRRTKLLRLRNLRFFVKHRRLAYDDPFLASADSVSITFEYQKNDERDITVTQHCTDDAILCPVRAWAAIVQRILSYPGTTDESPVNTFYDAGKLTFVDASDVKRSLRTAADILGPDRLGYASTDIGTHSLRSGAAMAMYLNDVPVYTIMLIGRWSSDAFLRYIRRQVQQFSTGVSARMIRTPHFFTVPDSSNIIHDPRTPNNPHSLASQNGYRNSTDAARRPAFFLFT